MLSACERRADVARAIDRPRDPPAADLIDVGTGPPLADGCPVQGFLFDGFKRGVFLDQCGHALITYDGGYSFERVKVAPPRAMRPLYDRLLERPYQGLVFGTAPRILHRAGGGVFETIREKRRLAPRELCLFDDGCASDRVWIGWTDHALVFSLNAGATWHVAARTTAGTIADAKIIDHQWRALVNGRVFGVAAGELVESKQPEVDLRDFLRGSSPAPNPLSCLESATVGSVTVSAHEKGCFSHRSHTLTFRWSGGAIELTAGARTKPISRAARSDALRILSEILARADGNDGDSTTKTSADVEWSCDGVVHEASFHSETHAANDEEAAAHRALALFRFAAHMD